MLRWLRYAWAAPASLCGLMLLPAAWLSGGSARISGGVVEIQGGWVAALLRKGLPWVGAGAAMTLGHVILAQDEQCMNRSRRHELVHVRQYERWGPLMIPLYLAASLSLYLRGLDPYLDNPFEQEAFSSEE